MKMVSPPKLVIPHSRFFTGKISQAITDCREHLLLSQVNILRAKFLRMALKFMIFRLEKPAIQYSVFIHRLNSNYTCSNLESEQLVQVLPLLCTYQFAH